MEALFSHVTGQLTIKRLLLAGVIIALLIAVRAELANAVWFALRQLFFISPLIVLAMAVTAYLMATNAVARLATLFSGNQIKMIVIVSIIGAITPVCGVTVLPLVAGLLIAGVPIAPIMAFLLSSPITSPEMLAITAGILGWPFAIGKSLAALGIGLLGGYLTLMLVRLGMFANPVRDRNKLVKLAGGGDCCGSEPVLWRYWQEAERRAVLNRSLLATSKLALTWLSIAFITEYFLHLYLPPEFLSGFVGNDNAWSVPIAATIGAPIYLDGYAALPLIRSLMDKGMADGAAMAFLIAGGITSAWAAIPVFALVRNSLFGFYILMAVVCSMLAGWGFGLALV